MKTGVGLALTALVASMGVLLTTATPAHALAGRLCRGHVHPPLRNCTGALDGQPVVVDGALVPDLAG